MAETELRRHPIRGAIWGLLLGLGLGLLLMVLYVLQASIPTLIIGGVVFAVLGGLWGAFAPPKKAPPPPGAAATEQPMAHEPMHETADEEPMEDEAASEGE